MIMAFALWAIFLPAAAAVGQVYAYMNDEDENKWMIFCSIFPPIATFCGISLLLKG